MYTSSIFNDADCRELNFDDHNIRGQLFCQPEEHESFLTSLGRGRKKRVIEPVSDMKTAASRIYFILTGHNHEN